MRFNIEFRFNLGSMSACVDLRGRFFFTRQGEGDTHKDDRFKKGKRKYSEL